MMALEQASGMVAPHMLASTYELHLSVKGVPSAASVSLKRPRSSGDVSAG